MEKTRSQSIDQKEDIRLENCIDWSIAFNDENVSSDDDVVVEPVSKRFVCGKRKRMVDNQPVRNLIINKTQEKPPQLLVKPHWSKVLLMDEVFKEVPKH